MHIINKKVTGVLSLGRRPVDLVFPIDLVNSGEMDSAFTNSFISDLVFVEVWMCCVFKTLDSTKTENPKICGCTLWL